MPRPTADAIRRFFRSPKGLLIVILTMLVGVALMRAGLTVMPMLLASVIAAVIVDVPILRLRGRAWSFPSGAILTGMIVAMVLSPQEPWYVAVCTSIIAIVSKWIFRIGTANVFNPAALGLVITFYVFHTGQSWWGALPELPFEALAVLITTGYFIASRVNKMPLVLSFLGIYFLLFTSVTFVSDPSRVVEIFRAPDLHAVLFFAFIILTDPPTSPIRYADQIVCGVLVAIVGFAVFEALGAAHYLLSGVLAGNAWEAWRRVRAKRARHHSPRPVFFVSKA
jgi:Na+-translocating ferredoxin:NAD+ oxidoreductase RnfD subunit